MAGPNDQGGRRDAGPRAGAPAASTAWSIPEIRVVKDDQGRLRIDQTDPATYGAYAARQLLATAEADPRYREGMTKRPSVSSIKITYVNDIGEPQAIGIREIFCRMEGDALVLTYFENAKGEKVKDLPIEIPLLGDPDTDPDDADRLHSLFLAELGDEPSLESPAESEPEPEPAAPEPVRERRLPTGPLRKYDEPAAPSPVPVAAPAPAPAPAAGVLKTPPAPESPPRGPAVTPPVAKPAKVATGAPPGLTVRALDEAEAAALRALIEAKAGQARWASGLLMQAAERQPSDRKLQNEHLSNLLRVSLDSSRAESGTPLAAALRGIVEEAHAYKAGVLDRDPLRAEKLALQPFARTALGAALVDAAGHPKTVGGTSQRTPAQVLAKLEDPKLARAARVKLLLEIVPEMIETWRPDKESARSEAGNENSPAIVRRLFAVANQQRQQRKFIDNGAAFKKANERYTVLEGKLPKASPADDS